MIITLPIETTMYAVSQWFLLPVLLVIALFFLYAFYALGAFVCQGLQRRATAGRGRELLALRQRQPELGLEELEAIAVQRLECARIVTRVAPMLGLVATMIPMGPALKALADGHLADVSRNLMVAFSAVILALIAAALTFVVMNVRRRWYAQELATLAAERRA